MNTSTGIIWVSINSPPRLLSFGEGQQLDWEMGKGEEALGAVLCSAGSGEEPGTGVGVISSPRRTASSSGVGDVQCSSPMGFRRET